MQQRIIWAGFIGTALITAIFLSIKLPVILAAFIVMGLGLVVTYYLAMSNKRLVLIEEMERFEQGVVRMILQKDIPSALQRLQAVSRTIDKELESLVFIIDTQANLSLPVPPGWEDIAAALKEGKQFFQEENGTRRITGSSATITSLLAVPVVVHEQVFGAVAVYSYHNRSFTKNHRKRLYGLSLQAAALIANLQEREQVTDYHCQLLVSLVAGIEAHDPAFRGHSQRVNTIAVWLGRQLGLEAGELNDLGYAAWLHDIGRNAGGIDEEHPQQGAAMLPATLEFTRVREAVLYHHERYDGSGYPKGLRHTEIPLAARIIAAADIYDALTLLAPSEERLEHRLALEVIKKATGSLFDPLVVVALEEIEDKLQELTRQWIES